MSNTLWIYVFIPIWRVCLAETFLARHKRLVLQSVCLDTTFVWPWRIIFCHFSEPDTYYISVLQFVWTRHLCGPDFFSWTNMWSFINLSLRYCVIIQTNAWLFIIWVRDIWAWDITWLFINLSLRYRMIIHKSEPEISRDYS